jgi:type I restriction enzyme S subunit
MTALVTDNLPLVSGAPNGIAKLRELILVLAVHGKLVSHDPSDEAAFELLERTAHARAQRPRRGKTQARPQAPDASKEWPYAIPSGWQWCRLADLVDVLNGRAYKKEELLDAGTPVLRVGNLFTSNHWYYSDLELDDDRYCLPGDLLYAWSASFGPFIWSGDRAIYHYHIWKLESHSDADLNKRYLHSFLTEQTQAIKAAGHGVSMTHMTKEKMERIAVPLPPLAEQARIVAKVDELMALCDRLEADQADAEAAHAQLVQALLASLTQARDASDFRASWQQLAEHFHTLFTTEASIDALKQTVLQLGVMGRLTSASKSASAAKSASPFAGATFEIPDDWKWCRFGDCWESSFYGPRFGKHDYVSAGGVPTIRTTDMSADGMIDLKNPPEVVLSTAQLQTYGLKQGDLLVTRSGSIGTMALFMLEMDAIPSAYLIRIRFLPRLLPRFGLIYLRSPMGQRLLGLNTTSVGVPNVNATKMATFPFALPPLKHQQQIVDKVEELLAGCDQLKRNLSQARQHHENLACVLVEQAVA